MSRIPIDPSLIGREDEINEIMTYLEAALNGNGTLLFIGGEAGVGKTRLINEFMELAKKKADIKTISGWCLSEAAIPYFPFIEAFNNYVEDLSNQKQKTLMTEQLGITGWLKGPQIPKSDVRDLSFSPAMEKERTFDAVAKVFLDITSQEPHILFLDDLQWADQLSLAMIHYLAKKCRESKLLIIGTYRTEDVSQRGEEIHPLMETIFSLSRDGLYNKIELNRLDEKDLPDLLNSMFNTSFSKEFVELLHRETEGNPLFTIETLNLLVEEGTLVEHDKQWSLSSSIQAIGIPSKIQDVITRRISKLGREQRKILDVAAVSGRSINPEILSRVLSVNIVDVFESLVDIERRSNLIKSVEHNFEFTHQKIREVIYDDLQMGLKRIYHLKTAQTIEQVIAEKASNGYMTEVAHHYLEGESPENAFDYLIMLGEKAGNVYANQEAIEYLSKSLEIAEQHPKLATPENLFRIYKSRGRAKKYADFDAQTSQNTLEDYLAMFEAAEKTENKKIMAEAYFRMGGAYNPHFDGDNGLKYFIPGLKLAKKIGEKSLEPQFLMNIGIIYNLNPETLDEGVRLFEEARKTGRETGDILVESWSLRKLCEHYKAISDFRKAKELLPRSIELMEEIREPFSLAFRYFLNSIVLAELGEYDTALYYAKKGLEMGQEYEIAPVSWLLNTIGWIYYQIGEYSQAIEYCNRSLEFARQREKTMAAGGIPNSLSVLGMIYFDKKDYEASEKFNKEALSLVHLHGGRPGGYSRLGSRIEMQLTEIKLVKGEYYQALKDIDEIIDIFEDARAKKYVAHSMKIKAEVLAKMNRFKEAHLIINEALGLAVETQSPFLMWRIRYAMGHIYAENGEQEKANQNYSKAKSLIEETASKLEDCTLAESLLSTPYYLDIVKYS